MKKFLLLLVLAAIGYGAYRYKDQILELVNSASYKDADQGDAAASPATDASKKTAARPDNRQATPASITERYPTPVFKPIEQLVGNWAKVPASAFPRQITLNEKVKYIIGGGKGSTTAPAGSKAVALSLDAGQLVIAPRKGSTVRGRIPIDATSFKAELAKAYGLYKQRKKGEVLKQRQRAKILAANTPPATAATNATRPSDPRLAKYVKKLGSIPARTNNGRVTLMVQSIRNRDVTEITLDEISHWGPVRYELVEKQPYWTGTVTYKTTSLFGTFNTEAMALMRNGKIVRWVYTGSLEEVP